MAQSKSPKLRADFPGSTLKWIHAAEPEFQRRNLDLDKYTVTVAEQDDSVVIALRSLDATKGARGSAGKFPEYEVEVSKNDMKIIRSNFVR